MSCMIALLAAAAFCLTSVMDAKSTCGDGTVELTYETPVIRDSVRNVPRSDADDARREKGPLGK